MSDDVYTPDPRAFLPQVVGGVAAAALVVPLLAHRGGASWLVSLATVAVAGGLGWILARRLPGSALVVLGLVVVAGAAWLLPQSRDNSTTLLLGVSLGAGVAFVLAPIKGSGELLRDGRLAVTTASAIAALAVLRALGGRTTALVVAVGLCVPAVVVALSGASGVRLVPRRGAVFVAVAVVLLTASVTGWIGANSPSAEWFGSLVSHGPREKRAVAMTFDDGPNATATLRVRDILDRYDVKATFFTVGKALDARPDISRALLDDGQLLGNHSYHHDSWSWLDPGYPELDRTQDAFHRRLGVCPAFYRPPHGQHTPFMAHTIGTHGMTMVTWDVSAADWATHDAKLVARRVLDRVRSGSIILLHDGLDGDVHRDRSVVVRALPLILEGLHQRGYRVVRLDRLLERPAYLDDC